MYRPSLLRPLLAVALLLVTTGAPALSFASTPAVQVQYDDPANFTETRMTPASASFDAQDYLGPLKRYIEQRASRMLKPGQRLSIVITDIDRAGSYEPWFGAANNWIRVVRRTYPPRIDLRFTLTSADGTVVREGTRKLLSLNFMDTVSANDSDNLRYEKALIDRWLRRGETRL